MSKMKRSVIVRFLAILTSCFLLIFTGCMFNNGYTSSEVEKMQETLAGLENNPNFALTHSDTIWLKEKKIIVDELSYNGTKIDRLFGCADEYFYASTRTRNNNGRYTIHFLRIDYNTLEMFELGCVEGLKQSYTSSCRLVGNDLYFYDSGKYCMYNIESGDSEWFEYNHEKFWAIEDGKYSFEIKERSVKITDTLISTQKEVSFKDHLGTSIEGKFIQEFDSKLTFYSSYFIDATEKNGICYLLALIPLDPLIIRTQAVILSYDFENEKLSYYSSIPYDIYGSTNLTIINRKAI